MKSNTLSSFLLFTEIFDLLVASSSCDLGDDLVEDFVCVLIIFVLVLFLVVGSLSGVNFLDILLDADVPLVDADVLLVDAFLLLLLYRVTTGVVR